MCSRSAVSATILVLIAGVPEMRITFPLASLMVFLYLHFPSL